MEQLPREPRTDSHRQKLAGGKEGSSPRAVKGTRTHKKIIVPKVPRLVGGTVRI